MQWHLVVLRRGLKGTLLFNSGRLPPDEDDDEWASGKLTHKVKLATSFPRGGVITPVESVHSCLSMEFLHEN